MAIQTANRHQVRLPRLSIRNTQAITARIGTSGTAGVRKARGRAGGGGRSTMTPIETSTKANRVPMLTTSARVVSGTKVAMRATTAPVMSEITQGVRKRGWTVVSPASAPSETRLAIQL